MSSIPSHNDEKKTGGPETRDANFKSVLFSGLGLMGILVIGLVLSWIVYRLTPKYAGDSPPATFATPDTARLPATPRLQPDPHAVLLAMRQAEDSVLTTYGLVNRDSGIVRVPIDRAMELLAQEVLPSGTNDRIEEKGKK